MRKRLMRPCRHGAHPFLRSIKVQTNEVNDGDNGEGVPAVRTHTSIEEDDDDDDEVADCLRFFGSGCERHAWWTERANSVNDD